jgi:outer membrane lipoprotein-sorting protein
MKNRILVSALTFLVSVPAWAAVDGPLSLDEMVRILATLDARQKSTGDYKSFAYIERKEKDKTDVVEDALIYRRDVDEKLVILFVDPKAEAGKGYLRLDKNMWFYDPSVGKWERRTDREAIGGTDARRNDFDQSKLAVEYDPTDKGLGKLGVYQVRMLDLKVKENVDVAYPIVKLWVDVATGNMLKRQDFALSGRLLRTLYYPQWDKIMSEQKKDYVWFPHEIRIYDEVEKANSTLVLMKNVELKPLDANMFTKAWLESKSR